MHSMPSLLSSFFFNKNPRLPPLPTMSYNGIGLKSAKGSSTSGHIQRNIADVKISQKQETKGKLFDNRKLQELKWEKVSKKAKATEIPRDEKLLDHERKRLLEVKVQEYRDRLEEGEEDDETIDRLVAAYRAKCLLEESKRGKASYKAKISPFD